jgi:hypothetical protein
VHRCLPRSTLLHPQLYVRRLFILFLVRSPGGSRGRIPTATFFGQSRVLAGSGPVRGSNICLLFVAWPREHSQVSKLHICRWPLCRIGTKNRSQQVAAPSRRHRCQKPIELYVFEGSPGAAPGPHSSETVGSTPPSLQAQTCPMAQILCCSGSAIAAASLGSWAHGHSRRCLLGTARTLSSVGAF